MEPSPLDWKFWIFHSAPRLRSRLVWVLGALGLQLLPAVAKESPNAPLEIAFAVRQDWREGFVGELIVINSSGKEITDWSLRLKPEFRIDGVWGASFRQAPEGVELLPQPWNKTLRNEGGRVIIGFNARPGFPIPPTEAEFNGSRIKIQNWTPQLTRPAPGTTPPKPVKLLLQAGAKTGAAWGNGELLLKAEVPSDWSSAAKITFRIFNKNALPWRDWSLAIPLPGRVVTCWNATLRPNKVENVYVFEGAGDWNRDILPNQHVEFGIIIEPGDLKEWAGQVTAGGMIQPSPSPAVAELLSEKKEQRKKVSRRNRKVPGPAPLPTPATTIPTSPEQPFSMDQYREALGLSFLFYEAQRSGKLPASNRVPWRGDSALEDGKDAGLDLAGGYHDAGDHVKFTFPMAYTLTVLSWGGIDYAASYQTAGMTDELLETVGWGTDWLLKATAIPNAVVAQVGDAFLDHSRWGPPETMGIPRPVFWIDTSRPGSDLAAECSAAFASSALLFRRQDPDYSETLLDRAEELYLFAKRNRGRYSDSVPQVRAFYNSFSGDADELVWAALWLYRATENRSFLEEAESLYDQELADRGLRGTLNWDDKHHGCLVLLSRFSNNPAYKKRLRQFLNYWTHDNPPEGIRKTPGGLAWLDAWGSLRYTANTAFLAQLTSDFLEDPDGLYAAFASRQTNYILGDNPQHRSYLIGFGMNYPKNPHHRAAHGSLSGSIQDPVQNRFVLVGALVGGPWAPRDEAYTDSRTDYRSNEVALDYNAALTGLLARYAAPFPAKSSGSAKPPTREKNAKPTPGSSRP